MFIINLTYIKPLEFIDQILNEHIEFLNKFFKQGIFLTSGRKSPRNGGVILAKAENKNELERIVKQDPFIIKEAATYEIIEFLPTRFGSLFEKIKDEL